MHVVWDYKKATWALHKPRLSEESSQETVGCHQVLLTPTVFLQHIEKQLGEGVFTQTTPEGLCFSSQGGYLASVCYFVGQNCCWFWQAVPKQGCRTEPVPSSCQQAQSNARVRYLQASFHPSIPASTFAQGRGGGGAHTASCFPGGRQQWTQHCSQHALFTAHRTRGKAK